MATANELRDGIAGARAALQAAITASADNWETSPPGDDTWSPRQVAEHVIPSEIFFATNVCGACGYDGPDNPLSSAEFATASDALAALTAVTDAANAKIQHVQDAELSKSSGEEGFAGLPAGKLMELNVWHLTDHAAQMIAPQL